MGCFGWKSQHATLLAFGADAYRNEMGDLLHDIGTGDGIVQGDALAGEIRTPALWGLRDRRPLLHDGSAATISDAIRRHAGEALHSAQRAGRLSGAECEALLAFLRTL